MEPGPLIFEPILKRRIWGGRRLETLGKQLPPEEPIGESWELADLEEDQSRVRVGPARGETLAALIEQWGEGLLGGVGLFEGRFPLLIKFLDAARTLSVQVHPDEGMARRLGGKVRVKNEAWYIIDAAEDGAIFCGLKEGVDRRAFEAAIAAGRVADTLRRVPVRAGDCHYLPSGTLHALGAGVLVAEVQTPSDITYRVYDWDRLDPATGRPRELHVEQALECIHFGEEPQRQQRSHAASVWTSVTRLVTCESFLIERVRLCEGFEQELPYRGMVVWLVLEGQGELAGQSGEPLSFGPGDTVLLPAALESARVRILRDTSWLEVTVPVPGGLAGRQGPDRAGLRRQPPGMVQINPPPPGERA